MNIGAISWTPEVVAEWLVIAAKTERVMPSAGPKMTQANMPAPIDYLSLLWDCLDKDAQDKEPRFRPTCQQVSIWEEVVLRWYPMITDKRDMKILWMRSCGMGWTRIGKKMGLHRMTISINHARALKELTETLRKYYL